MVWLQYFLMSPLSQRGWFVAIHDPSLFFFSCRRLQRLLQCSHPTLEVGLCTGRVCFQSILSCSGGPAEHSTELVTTADTTLASVNTLRVQLFETEEPIDERLWGFLKKGYLDFPRLRSAPCHEF